MEKGMEDIGNNREKIRVLRIGRGLSVNEFAKLSNVSKSYISNIERGVQKNPSLIVMSKLAKTLEVPLEELLPYRWGDEPEKNAKWMSVERLGSGMTGKITAQMDIEWLELIRQAKKLGLTVEDIKRFLE